MDEISDVDQGIANSLLGGSRGRFRDKNIYNVDYFYGDFEGTRCESSGHSFSTTKIIHVPPRKATTPKIESINVHPYALRHAIHYVVVTF